MVHVGASSAHPCIDPGGRIWRAPQVSRYIHSTCCSRLAHVARFKGIALCPIACASTAVFGARARGKRRVFIPATSSSTHITPELIRIVVRPPQISPPWPVRTARPCRPWGGNSRSRNRPSGGNLKNGKMGIAKKGTRECRGKNIPSPCLGSKRCVLCVGGK